MKKHLFTIVASALTAFLSYGQLIPNRILNWGFPSSEYINRSHSINDSITYIGGMYADSTYVDPTNPSTKVKGSSAANIFLSKYDRKNNDLLWSIGYPNAVDHQFMDYTVDASGNIFVFIQFSQGFDVDPSSGTTTVSSVSSGAKSAVIVKFDVSGNYVSHKLITQTATSSTWVFPTSIKVKTSGDIVITGYSSGAINFDYGVTNFSPAHNGNDNNIFVAQYDNNLGLEWVYSPNQGASQSAISLFTDVNLNTTIHFKSGNGFVLPSSTIVSTSSDADCVIKLDDTGSPFWSGYVPSTGSYSGNNQIAVSEDGSFVFTGALNGANVDVNLGGGSTSLTMHYYADAFVAFYSANGNMKWANTFYGQTYTYAYSPAMHNGKIYLTFTGFGTIDMDPTAAIVNFSGPSYFNDYIASYDTTGKYLWANLYPDKFNGNGVNMSFYGNQINLHPKNWGAAAGQTIDADFSSNVLNITHYGSQDNSLFIYDFCSATTYSNTASVCSGDSVQIAGKWRKTAGIYKDTLKTPVYKCDSIIITNLTVNALPSILVSSSASLLCIGQTASLTASGASTYTWSSLQNTPVIVVNPTATTNYSVTGVDVNGCRSSAVITQSVSLCTTMEELLMEGINIYPNPSTGIVTVRQPFTKATVEVKDILGKVVYQSVISDQSQMIDLSGLGNGMYYLTISANNTILQQKLIKE